MKNIVICHPRHNFYNAPIWWYEFSNGATIPSKFLNVPDTKYYEYGGTHMEAIEELSNLSFDIVGGNEI